MRIILTYLACLLTPILAHAQKADRQVFWRDNQIRHITDSSRVVRVYLDKFGNFYPSTEVAIDEKLFLHPTRRANSHTTTSGNLLEYFRKNAEAQQALMLYYKVQGTGNYENDYNTVELQQLSQIDRQVHQLVQKRQAKNIIFLIHGFNVTDPDSLYIHFERSVKDKYYEEQLKPTADKFNWTYSFETVNDGKRQADSVSNSDCVLSYDGQENLSDSYIIPMYSRIVRRTGSIVISDTTHDVKTFTRIDKDIYLVRLMITYKDRISEQKYFTTEYYKINLNPSTPLITGYNDDQKHSTKEKHAEFHNIFRLYFNNIDE